MAYKDVNKQKEYHKIYIKQHYLKNKKYYKNKNILYRKNLRKWLNNYKSKLKCIYCEESTPCCLDFHHKNKHSKESTIANAIHGCWSIKRIETEIKKCVVVCSNCHRKLHAGIKLTPKVSLKDDIVIKK